MLKTGDGWAIMFWAISFASALMLGIMDKRGSLCKASCNHDSIKFKRLDSLAKIVVLLLCMSFIYYIYDLVKGGLETKSLTPFTSCLIPIGLLSLILLSLAHVIEKNTRRD